MATSQQSPAVTMQHSPAESLLSAPGDNLPSLFSTSDPTSASPTMNPMDMMTPSSPGEDPSRLSAVPEDQEEASNDGEKKPTKKRKSWGQVLPEPKTNLPPRKRAKTEDEKEQRRVERVLRNRRAAQSSRERKRLEVEALEQRNKELELELQKYQQTNFALLEELKRHRRENGVVVPTAPSSSLGNTLSSQLFTGQGLDSGSLTNLVTPPTVNPASLTPEPTEEEPSDEQPSQSSEVAPAASSDMTQRPAVMLCDLQCQTSEEPCLTPSSRTWTWMAFLMTLVSTSVLSACQRPLTQIAMSLKADFSIAPSPQVLTTIIWLVTLPTRSRRRSTSTNGSSATNRTKSLRTFCQRTTTPLQTYLASSRKASTLRVKLLKKILSSSPNLARPLSDATFRALRLASRGQDDRIEARSEPSLSQGVDDELTNCLRRIDLPPREVLLTLLWTLRVEQRRMGIKEQGRRGSSMRPDHDVLDAADASFTIGTFKSKVANTPA